MAGEEGYRGLMNRDVRHIGISLTFYVKTILSNLDFSLLRRQYMAVTRLYLPESECMKMEESGLLYL